MTYEPASDGYWQRIHAYMAESDVGASVKEYLDNLRAWGRNLPNRVYSGEAKARAARITAVSSLALVSAMLSGEIDIMALGALVEDELGTADYNETLQNATESLNKTVEDAGDSLNDTVTNGTETVEEEVEDVYDTVTKEPSNETPLPDDGEGSEPVEPVDNSTGGGAGDGGNRSRNGSQVAWEPSTGESPQETSGYDLTPLVTGVLAAGAGGAAVGAAAGTAKNAADDSAEEYDR